LSLEILEYCDASIVIKREQYYLDLFNPIYNIAKTAGSSLGIKRSVETKLKLSKSLKGVYTGNKSKLFGKTIDNATRNKMSISKAGVNNPLYGKTHKESTKNLMSLAKKVKV